MTVEHGVTGKHAVNGEHAVTVFFFLFSLFSAANKHLKISLLFQQKNDEELTGIRKDFEQQVSGRFRFVFLRCVVGVQFEIV